MKKLLTNLLLAVLLNGFISAAPAHCSSIFKSSNISKTEVDKSHGVKAEATVLDIYPFDVFASKFN